MIIEDIHKRNKELILKYNLFTGKVLRLKKDYKEFKKGDAFTISHIHRLYGWVLFEETEQLPQEAEELLKITDIKYSLGCGKKIKRINQKEKEVLNNPNFICGVADGWGKETLCFKCRTKLKKRWAEDERRFKNDN